MAPLKPPPCCQSKTSFGRYIAEWLRRNDPHPVSWAGLTRGESDEPPTSQSRHRGRPSRPNRSTPSALLATLLVRVRRTALESAPPPRRGRPVPLRLPRWGAIAGDWLIERTYGLSDEGHQKGWPEINANAYRCAIEDACSRLCVRGPTS